MLGSTVEDWLHVGIYLNRLSLFADLNMPRVSPGSSPGPLRPRVHELLGGSVRPEVLGASTARLLPWLSISLPSVSIYASHSRSKPSSDG